MIAKKNPYKLKGKLFNLILVSFFLALLLIINYLFNLLPRVSGISFELYLAILPFCLIFIPLKPYSFLLLIVFPFVKMLIIPDYAINFYDLLLEYFLSIYIYFPFIFLNIWSNYSYLAKKRKKAIYLIIFIILNIFILTTRFFFFVIASYLWYIPNQWWLSFVYELNGYWLTYITCIIISIFLGIMLLKMIPKLKTRYWILQQSNKKLKP